LFSFHFFVLFCILIWFRKSMLAAQRAEAAAWPLFAERLLDARFASAHRNLVGNF